MTERHKISGRSRLYLEACRDWKADWEIVILMGDSPPMQPRYARPHLGRLVVAGLLSRSYAQNTYRLTEAGRAALAGGEMVDKAKEG